MWVHCIAHVHVCGDGWGGGTCVALCLVLTHPAINYVSTAAVCIGQIESSATGPFCFSPLGWVSRPPYSHWSKLSLYFWPSILLCVCLILFFYSTHFFLSFAFKFSPCAYVAFWDRISSRARGAHSFACCSFLGLVNKRHMCSVPTSTLHPPFSMWLHKRAWETEIMPVCESGKGGDFRLVLTSFLAWPMLWDRWSAIFSPTMDIHSLAACPLVFKGEFF